MKTRRHLFIQLGSYDPTELAGHLEELYQAGGPLVDLIVAQTGDRSGNLYTTQLAILDPYLPWGAKRIAANIFFGTNVDYTSSTDPYGQDMLNSAFRWQQLNIQRACLKSLNARYLGKNWHFYIEHETALNKLVADTGIAAGYEAFLIQSVRDFRQMYKPSSAVAWSPGFWNENPQPNATEVLGRLFSRIQSFAGSPGIDWMLLQNMTGRPWGGIVKPYHVKAWHDALGKSFRSKQINVEQFRYLNGHMASGDPAEIAQTEKAYKDLGMKIGASWEMRWYMRQAETGLPDLTALSREATGASWPRYAAQNTWTHHLNQVFDWLTTGVHRGKYSRRAELAEFFGREIRRLTGLEVQGIRYMRPKVPDPSSGRIFNSDHLTAGAIDIMIRRADEMKYLPALYHFLDRLEERHIVRYIVKQGANPAHWNHIHVSFQTGAHL